jgi:RNA polymerase primary sigma factor
MAEVTLDRSGLARLACSVRDIRSWTLEETIVSTLSEREQKVLTMRFGLSGKKPCTLDEVGQELGVTRERIRQLERKAMDKLREAWTEEAEQEIMDKSMEALY